MLRRLGAEIYLREMWRREVVSWPCSSTNTPLPQTDPLLHEARNLLKQKLICEWFCGRIYLLQGVDLRKIKASCLSSTTTQPTSHSQTYYGFKRTIWVEIYSSKITITNAHVPHCQINIPMATDSFRVVSASPRNCFSFTLKLLVELPPVYHLH